MMHDVKMVYEQVWCPSACAFVDCPLLYMESCFTEDEVVCELIGNDSCREDFKNLRTRQIVECKQLKNFSAYVENIYGYWGVLETSKGVRCCDYLEVDGKVIFDHEQSHNVER